MICPDIADVKSHTSTFSVHIKKKTIMNPTDLIKYIFNIYLLFFVVPQMKGPSFYTLYMENQLL